MDERRPDIRDVFTNPYGMTIIRDTHPHPAADGQPIGYILPTVDGEYAWTTDTPTDPIRVQDWNTADTYSQAAEELLAEHMSSWQHEYDRATEWETYNRTHAVDGRRVA